MSLRLTVLAAMAAVGSAHPYLEPRQLNMTNSTSNLTLPQFIDIERPIALTGAIANVGGTNDSVVGDGPSSGVVVASPSLVNPDYFYTWTRDSALTMLMLSDELIFGTNTSGNNSLQTILEEYAMASAMVQTVTNPSGTFYPAGQGLGEPKFYTNLTRFDGTWGRPQNDGPALRASTLMEIAEAIYQRNENASQIVSEVYWPIIENDLKFVAQYWNTTSYDLWEEVNGNSFFTTSAQHRALVQGSIWAERLNTTCEYCAEQAPEILCFLQNNFWNESGNYILANINANQVNRSQINCDPILAAMHNFDINATCNATSLQPCNSRVLATHKVWVDTFRNLYPVNNNASAPEAILTGRYPEDTYYAGNPWYITTLAAAEVLYDAVAQMTKAGSYEVDDTNMDFFMDLVPSVETGTYSGDNLTNLTDAMTTYADGFADIISGYLPTNGSLSEQINKTTGEPTSASALTWSFAAFVTMSQRRAGQFPPSWGANSTYAMAANDTCSWAYYNSTFTYAPAMAAGAQASEPYNNETGCLTEVIFYVNASTMFGNNVYIAGNTSLFNNSLGNTAALNLPMHTGNITTDSPTWYVPLWFPADDVVEYNFVLTNGSSYTVENITRTVTASPCGGPAVLTTDVASFPNATDEENVFRRWLH